MHRSFAYAKSAVGIDVVSVHKASGDSSHLAVDDF